MIDLRPLFASAFAKAGVVLSWMASRCFATGASVLTSGKWTVGTVTEINVARND